MKNKIKATVFIPTWFGEDYLGELLQQVFKQKVDFEYEVLIYDTSSKDKTPQIIEKFAKKHSNLRHKTITKDQYGHGKTRREAAHDAKGEIVVYLSQDATPAHDRWLYEMVKPFEISDSIVAVMGKQDPRPKAFPLLKREIMSVFGNFGPDDGLTLFYKDYFVKEQSTYDRISFYSDVNSASRKEFMINNIGYKDVPYAEDQLFGRDIIDAGYIKVYNPRGNVLHSNEFKIGEYKNRMFDETMGLRRVGIPVAVPGLKSVVRAIITGTLRDVKHTISDDQYSLKRKLYFIATSPIYNIEKWRGVRLASRTKLNDDDAISKYSLEDLRNRN